MFALVQFNLLRIRTRAYVKLLTANTKNAFITRSVPLDLVKKGFDLTCV